MAAAVHKVLGRRGSGSGTLTSSNGRPYDLPNNTWACSRQQQASVRDFAAKHRRMNSLNVERMSLSESARARLDSKGKATAGFMDSGCDSPGGHSVGVESYRGAIPEGGCASTPVGSPSASSQRMSSSNSFVAPAVAMAWSKTDDSPVNKSLSGQDVQYMSTLHTKASSGSVDALTVKSSVVHRFSSMSSSLRKKAAPRARTVTKTRTFQMTMVLALLIALFLPDIWVLLNRPDNTDLDVILTCVFILFNVEICVQSIGQFRTYCGTFFFWMDCLGSASLVLDISYLGLIPQTRTNQGSSSEAVITRAARMAKLGARAGRLTRLVKLLRFLPGVRNLTGAEQLGAAKVISGQLTLALSMRVSCLILIIVMAFPLFGIVSYPEDDWSMESWIQILELTALHDPEWFAQQLTEFTASYDDLNYWPYRLTVRPNVVVSSAVLAALPLPHSRGSPERSMNTLTFEGESLVCDFNFEEPAKMDSIMNILMLFLVVVLMVGFSLLLSGSVATIVVVPLENLLTKVQLMASSIFSSVNDMVNAQDADDLDSEAKLTDTQDDEVEVGGFFEETATLERVVRKLATLGEIAAAKNGACLDVDMDALKETDRAVIHSFSGVQERVSYSDEEMFDELQHEEMGFRQRQMLESAGLSMDFISSWNLNPLELDKARCHAAVVFFVGQHNHGVNFDSVSMSHFLEAAEVGYIKHCSYHSWFHAVDVTHFVYRALLRLRGEQLFSQLERFALLVAATCHDLGHPGWNNSFLIETAHELALRYNDKSPLENMHCAKLFELAGRPKTSIFGLLVKQHFSDVRKTVIQAILHTDNTHHSKMVRDVQVLYEMNSDVLNDLRLACSEHAAAFPTKEAAECYRKPDTKTMLLNFILHFADLSNSMKPFRICRIWAWKVLDEFFAQGDEEKRLGLPVQALNDRDKVNRPFSQVGFIEFLVSPLLHAAVRVLPPLHDHVDQLLTNVTTWNQVWLAETKPPPSEAEQQTLAERVNKLQLKFADVRV